MAVSGFSCPKFQAVVDAMGPGIVDMMNGLVDEVRRSGTSRRLDFMIALREVRATLLSGRPSDELVEAHAATLAPVPFNLVSADPKGTYANLGEVVFMFTMSASWWAMGVGNTWAEKLYLRFLSHTEGVVAVVGTLGCNVLPGLLYVGEATAKHGWRPSKRSAMAFGDLEGMSVAVRRGAYGKAAAFSADPEEDRLVKQSLSDARHTLFQFWTGGPSRRRSGQGRPKRLIDAACELRDGQSVYVRIRIDDAGLGHANLVRIRRERGHLLLFLFEPHGMRRGDEYGMIVKVAGALVQVFNDLARARARARGDEAKRPTTMTLERGFCPRVQGALPLCGAYSLYLGLVDDLLQRRTPALDDATRRALLEATCRERRERGDTGVQLSARSARRVASARRSLAPSVLRWMDSHLVGSDGLALEGSAESTCASDLALLVAAVNSVGFEGANPMDLLPHIGP